MSSANTRAPHIDMRQTNPTSLSRGRGSLGSILTPRTLLRQQQEASRSRSSSNLQYENAGAKENTPRTTGRSASAAKILPALSPRNRLQEITSTEKQKPPTVRVSRQSYSSSMEPPRRLEGSTSRSSISSFRSFQGSFGGIDRRPASSSEFYPDSMDLVSMNKRTLSPYSSSSQGSLTTPVNIRTTSSTSLIDSITSQHSWSHASTVSRSCLRKRRKTLDAVRPDHIPVSESSRSLSYFQTNSRFRDSLRMHDSFSSFGRQSESFSSRGRSQTSSSRGSWSVPRPMLFEGNGGDPVRQWEEEARRRASQANTEEVSNARRYSGIERPMVDEGSSGLKVSSVLSFKREPRPPSVIDSSRSSLLESKAVL